MKSKSFSRSAIKVGLVLGILGNSCGSSETNQHTLDSIARADSLLEAYHPFHGDPTRWVDSCAQSAIEVQGREIHTLEGLLDIKDEVELRRKFGADNVTYDTIWGTEGFFSMGTILKTEPESHIEITWENEKTKTGIISVTLVSDQDLYSDSLGAGAWFSSTGVTLAMPISKLEIANMGPFTFSGFGWDYAGSVLDWQKGNLDGKGIAVQLAEGPAAVELTPEESAQILGDVMVQSDNPLLKPFRPRVWAISVAKVQ